MPRNIVIVANIPHMHITQARIQRGGGARPPVFASNSLKSPLNLPKYAQKLAPEPPAPPPLQILDPPCNNQKFGHSLRFLFFSSPRGVIEEEKF